jgi:hypothetical protein
VAPIAARPRGYNEEWGDARKPIRRVLGASAISERSDQLRCYGNPVWILTTASVDGRWAITSIQIVCHCSNFKKLVLKQLHRVESSRRLMHDLIPHSCRSRQQSPKKEASNKND